MRPATYMAALVIAMTSSACTQPNQATTPDPGRTEYERVMQVLRTTRAIVRDSDPAEDPEDPTETLTMVEAFNLIHDRSGIHVMADWSNMDETWGLDPKETINIDLDKSSLADVLEAVIRKMSENAEDDVGYEPAFAILVDNRRNLPRRPEGLLTTSFNDEGERKDRMWRINIHKSADSKTGVYIPANLEECFSELKAMLHPDLIERMKTRTEADMIEYHFGLGMWLRNNWGLWGDSRLEKYFTSLGVQHPDDMSGIILSSFWRHLNGRPLAVDDQIAYYKRYWDSLEKTGRPPTDDDDGTTPPAP